MRKINLIVIHCSATVEGKPFTAKSIDWMHRERGFKKIGYHYVIGIDGKREFGRSEEEVGAHAIGYNANSIGICYIGGIGKNGGAKDTRTLAQKAELLNLIRELKLKYPGATVVGHRDLSPDLNRDGKITPEEFVKSCPCFNARTEYDAVTIAGTGGKLRPQEEVRPLACAGAVPMPNQKPGVDEAYAGARAAPTVIDQPFQGHVKAV